MPYWSLISPPVSAVVMLYLSFYVADGFDMADNEIVKRVASGDLVISAADIPLWQKF